MLVLGRSKGQKLILKIPPCTEPRDVEIMLVKLDPLAARIGIEAPDDIEVLRDELIARTPDDIN